MSATAALKTETKMQTSPTVPRVLLSIAETAQATGLGRSTVYVAIAKGKLRTVKLGRRRLIRAEDLESFVNSLVGAEQ